MKKSTKPASLKAGFLVFENLITRLDLNIRGVLANIINRFFGGNMTDKKNQEKDEEVGRFGVRTPDTFFPIGQCSRQEAKRIASAKGGIVVPLKEPKKEVRIK